MANLQALGADNETIIYLAAEGDGGSLSPYKSIFSSEQYGDWNVTILNPSLAVTGDFYLDIQPVSQSGVWTVTVDNFSAVQDVAQSGTWAVEVNNFPTVQTVDGTVTADTGLAQPLTDTELRASDIGVTVSNLPATQAISAASLPLPTGAATETKQDDIVTALAATLTVDTGLTQSLTDSQLRASPIEVNQATLPGLAIPPHDYIELGYTGADLTTVIYKSGGAAGTVEATLALTYADGNLSSVTRV